MKPIALVAAAAIACAPLCTAAQPEARTEARLEHAERTVSIDSGMVANTSAQRAAVFSEVLAVDGAHWLRLILDGTELPAGV
ncbi:MAG: hypothetical protein AAFY46_16775, partial [Planctomycetota bacterium]